MAEVGADFVSIVPSAKGFGRALDGQIGGDVNRSGSKAGKIFGSALKAGALAVLGGAAALGAILKDSIGEARESQKVGAVTTQVIKSTGKAAKISADQVGDLATAISNKTGIDDEAIQSGANLLLTFKNIKNEAGKGNDIFSQTTAIMTDMATAMGQEPKAAAIQLGKALNDPIKGIAALGRVGVTFSDSQKKAIKAMVESGDVMGAQKVILKELQSEFGGTAAAASTAGEKFKTAFGNLEEQIGTALLPVIDKVAAFLTTKVIPAVSSFIDQLQSGEGLGGRVRRVFDNITTAVQSVITWGKKDAFPALRDAYRTVLPAVQGALDTIWPKLQDIGNVTWGKLQSGIDALKSLTTMDFSQLDAKELGTQLGSALVDGLSGLAKITGKITDTLGKLFDKVDWVGIGITVGKQVPAILLGLAAGILNFDFGSLLEGLKDHWGTILIGVLTIAFSPSKLIGPLAKILTKIPFVGRFLAVAVTWLNDLGGRLASFGGDLLKTFWQGFTKSPIPGAGFVVRFVKSIASLPGRLHDFMVTIQTQLGVWALDAFGAMGRGARSAIGGLLKFVALLPIRILRAVGSLARLLFPRGYEAVAGMTRGIVGRIGSLVSTVRSIPGKILSAIGDLAGSMVGKGEDIVHGIIRGIGNMGGQLRDFVIRFVKDHIPGPVAKALGIKSPSKVMRDEIGRWIPLGIVEGIRGTRGVLDREVASLVRVPSVDSARVAANAAADAAASLEPIDYRRLADAVADAVSRLHMSVPISSVDRAVVGRLA